MTTFYAIKHISTGAYIPHVNRAKAGATYMEPSTTEPPRMFKRRSHADNALQWWLRGKLVWYTSPLASFDDEPTVRLVPVPSRKAEDMDIVEIQIVEVG